MDFPHYIIGVSRKLIFSILDELVKSNKPIGNPHNYLFYGTEYKQLSHINHLGASSDSLRINTIDDFIIIRTKKSLSNNYLGEKVNTFIPSLGHVSGRDGYNNMLGPTGQLHKPGMFKIKTYEVSSFKESYVNGSKPLTELDSILVCIEGGYISHGDSINYKISKLNSELKEIENTTNLNADEVKEAILNHMNNTRMAVSAEKLSISKEFISNKFELD